MPSIVARAVLLDIEGTTSSISFVYDVMFPFVRRELEAYLQQNWGTPGLDGACKQIAQDTGASSFVEWSSGDAPETQQQDVIQEVHRLMDGDFKTTGLKQLQGMIWKAGFESGELCAHVYPDVPPALERWEADGLQLRIYSSGSIAAQKLFFGHTAVGDLLPHFQGHYDTTSGGKREAESYQRIAADMQLAPNEILFLSDIVAELDAAASSGFQTLLCCRPGNADPQSDHEHGVIHDFSEVECRFPK